jgi:hypothetical protein
MAHSNDSLLLSPLNVDDADADADADDDISGILKRSPCASERGGGGSSSSKQNQKNDEDAP